ncbi:hypothetical protein [Streptomyces sp. NPDC001450]
MVDHLRRIDLSQQWTEMSANAILSALAALGDPAAVSSGCGHPRRRRAP